MKTLLASITLYLAFTLCLCQTTPAFAQTINIDAALRYWQITDALRQDKPLTDDVWQEFLALPANQLYVPGVLPGESLTRYRRALEVVYMPRYDSLLQARLKANSWFYVLINDYKQQEATFKEYVLAAAKQPAYLDLMYTYAYQYLPHRAHSKLPSLNIYYTPLGNDAVSRTGGLVFSLRAAMDWNKTKSGILEAHEMHHQLRPRLDFSAAPQQDQPLLWALSAIQNEGTADLIDKSPLLRSTDSTAIREWLLRPAPEALHQLDSVLQSASKTNAAVLPTRAFYQRLFSGSGGHFPGFYMARIIEKQGYKPQMLATIDNPFAFLSLYQRAAKQDKAHPFLFTKASLTYLKALEKRTSKHSQRTAIADTTQSK